jgi:hypothetical protein
MRMEQELVRLIFSSRSLIAGEGQEATAGHVSQICAAARKNNATSNMTGVLLFDSVSFVEMLEGRRNVVEATFQRIQRDDRHSNVQILSFKRLFAISCG